MEIAEFWALIEETKLVSNRDSKRQADLLVEMLSQKEISEIINYAEIYHQLENTAYRCDLWDAANIIEGGLGDSGFRDFRAWLIGQGKDIFERTLENPEYLVDIVELGQDIRDEYLLYVAMNAYEAKTGTVEIPAQYTNVNLVGQFASDPQTKFPRLHEKFSAYWDSFD